MAISRVGTADGGNSVTFPAHQAGDLIIAYAFRDGNLNPPTFPSGENWSALSPSFLNGSTCASRQCYKIARDSSEASGVFTNATSVVCEVYRGVDQANPLGGQSLQQSTGTTVTFGTVTMVVGDGSSWVTGFVGHRSTDVAIETAPSGMTNNNTISDGTDEAASHDTNGGVSSWSSQTAALGGSSGGWTTWTVEIRAAPNATGTVDATLPILVQAAVGLQAITSTVAQALSIIAQSAAATAQFAATVVSQLPSLLQSIVGTARTLGVGAAVLPSLQQTASATEQLSGTVDAGLPPLGQSALGTSLVDGVVDQALPGPLQSVVATNTDPLVGVQGATLPRVRQYVNHPIYGRIIIPDTRLLDATGIDIEVIVSTRN